VYSIGSVGLEVVVMERRGICLVVLLGGGACVGPQVNEHAVVLERDDLPENQTQEGEICEGWGAVTPCGPDDSAQQFCMVLEESAGEQFEWGVCVVAPECDPGDSKECGEDGLAYCELDPRGVPQWGECEDVSGGEESTPLVIQFAGEPLGFDAASTAAFDLGGECLATDWPHDNTPWLAIDLDGSGSIDGGHELFGSATRLPDGTRAPNGFVALAALDVDHDGAITRADPAYASIVLWTDHDRDRRSTHWEHTSLSSAGIDMLPIAYETRSECDQRGNCGRERATVFAAGPRARAPARSSTCTSPASSTLPACARPRSSLVSSPRRAVAPSRATATPDRAAATTVRPRRASSPSRCRQATTSACSRTTA
jgi:hypothetical protein